MAVVLPPPLAERLRPQSLADFIGQSHLLTPGKPLYRAISTGALYSMVFWGPPGTGKTSLARIIANDGRAHFIKLSAVLAGVKDVRAAVTKAREVRQKEQRATVLFVDEVHRFNKSQQDAFLPFIEDGTLIFIGATTENPSFALNNALLSRLQVYVLKRLPVDALHKLLERALSALGSDLQRHPISASAREQLLAAADGDGRRLLVLLDIARGLIGAGEPPDAAIDAAVRDGSERRFDRGGDIFYDQISALHKSVRGSAPDAALYWLQRMLDGGCDPAYIARRVLRMASEDIGNADPRALRVALDSCEVYERLGSPEGELALAQAVLYLACAPKSNAVYSAFKAARQAVIDGGSLEVPLALRNAPTRLLERLGHAGGYRYAHDEPGAYAAGAEYLPAELQGSRYYRPVRRGLEIKIADKLARLATLDQQARKASASGEEPPDD